MASSLTVTRTVDAPIEAVWAVATDLENAPRTMSGITRVEVLDGGSSVDGGPSFGVGTRWRETRTMTGREETEEMVVTRADCPNGCTVEADNHGVHYVSTFTFTPLRSPDRAVPDWPRWSTATPDPLKTRNRRPIC